MVARIKCGKTEGYVEAKHDDVWQYIKSNYRQWKGEENITLMYLTKRFVPGETSLIVNTKDADTFLDFLSQHVLPLECIEGAYIFNLMKPTFFPIPTGTCLDLKRFTVTINAIPSQYNEIYDIIRGIKPTKFFVVGYIAYTFQEHGSDIMVSVLAKGLPAAKKGVLEHIEQIDGVLDTNIVWITKTKKLYSGSEAEKFKGTPYVSDEALGLEVF
jgi:hypothetical protein